MKFFLRKIRKTLHEKQPLGRDDSVGSVESFTERIIMLAWNKKCL